MICQIWQTAKVRKPQKAVKGTTGSVFHTCVMYVDDPTPLGAGRWRRKSKFVTQKSSNLTKCWWISQPGLAGKPTVKFCCLQRYDSKSKSRFSFHEKGIIVVVFNKKQEEKSMHPGHWDVNKHGRWRCSECLFCDKKHQSRLNFVGLRKPRSLAQGAENSTTF